MLVWRGLLCLIYQKQICLLFFQFDLSVFINHLGDNIFFYSRRRPLRVHRISSLRPKAPRMHSKTPTRLVEILPSPFKFSDLGQLLLVPKLFQERLESAHIIATLGFSDIILHFLNDLL